MNFNGLASLGWREALMIISIVLVVYIVFTLIRLQGLKRQVSSPLDPSDEPTKPNVAIAAYQEALSEPPPEAPLSSTEARAKDKLWYEPPANDHAVDDSRVGAVERELVLLKKDRKRLLSLEQELAQFRKEVGSLRAEILLLRETTTKTPRMASPYYNDAMEMAQQGHDADAISQHCGISRAEADLVSALAKHRD